MTKQDSPRLQQIDGEVLLQPIRSKRLSEFAVDQIAALIEEGRFVVGEKLPSERELIRNLGVSRASVREALRILEAQGLIEVQPGRGAFVVAKTTEVDFRTSLLTWFKEHRDEVQDILAVRKLLDSYAARIAARSASPEIVNALRSTVQDMQDSVAAGRLVDAISADKRFHRLLYKATGNSFLEMLGDSIVAMLFGPRHSILRLPGEADESAREHLAIVESIDAGDEDAAEKHVRAHTERIQEDIMKLSGSLDKSVRSE